MNAAPPLPGCSKCQQPLPPAHFNRDEFLPCPACGSLLRVELFPALFRPAVGPTVGEWIVTPGEAACFYHDSRKATVVCDGCGRFLCGLCDCPVHGRHYCPACLESGRQQKSIVELDTMRPLYGYQALLCAVVPLFITGLAAIYLALRYRNAPGSLVGGNRRWQMRLALILGLLQVGGIGLWIYALATG